MFNIKLITNQVNLIEEDYNNNLNNRLNRYSGNPIGDKDELRDLCYSLKNIKRKIDSYTKTDIEIREYQALCDNNLNEKLFTDLDITKPVAGVKIENLAMHLEDFFNDLVNFHIKLEEGDYLPKEQIPQIKTIKDLRKIEHLISCKIGTKEDQLKLLKLQHQLKQVLDLELYNSNSEEYQQYLSELRAICHLVTKYLINSIRSNDDTNKDLIKVCLRDIDTELRRPCNI